MARTPRTPMLVWTGAALATLTVLFTTAPGARAQDAPQPAPEATLVAQGAPPAAPPQTTAAPAAAPAVPEAPPPAPPDAVAAPPAVAPAVVTDLSARVDELDQLARIAYRKHELLEEEAAKKAKEAPVFSVDDKGVQLKSADGKYALKVRALLQVDGRFFLNDAVLQDRDTFLIRRLRPYIEGTLFGLVDYRLLPDFAGATAQVLDAYIDVHPTAWLRLRAGKMKAPIGLERLQSDADLSFIERGLDQNLSTTRDVGAQLWGDIAEGLVNYSLGVYNGGPDASSLEVDTNHAKDFIGRLFFHPFRTEGLAGLGNLGVGVAASTGNRKGLPQVGTTAASPNLPAFRTPGQNTFFQYLAPSGDTAGIGTTFAHLRASRLNPQLYYYIGGLGLQGEYLLSRQEVQRGNDKATLTHHAAHGIINYVVNGKAGYDGATPLLPFDFEKGFLGALELAVRYSWLKADSDTFPTFANPTASARVANSLAGAVSWLPRRSFKASVNFEQTRFTGGAANPDKTIADRKTENLLLGRLQVNF
jgi:phosphate-selective porin OprO and OprP